MKHKRTARESEGGNVGWGPALPDRKTSYKASGRWNRIKKNPKIDPSTYGNLVYDKDSISNHQSGDECFNK